jgi:hypothetical protein
MFLSLHLSINRIACSTTGKARAMAAPSTLSGVSLGLCMIVSTRGIAVPVCVHERFNAVTDANRKKSVQNR